jgi:hypothetical protein
MNLMMMMIPTTTPVNVMRLASKVATVDASDDVKFFDAEELRRVQRATYFVVGVSVGASRRSTAERI